MYWRQRLTSHRAALSLVLVLFPSLAVAGGPKHVAGTTYFNPGVVGQPVRWASGQIAYYTDQGPLSPTVTNQQATAMVQSAAALWSAVPTAAVNIVAGGHLNEDVSGLNIAAAGQSLAQPSDVTPNAANYPVGVLFDADGSILDSLFGAYTSDLSNCQNNGVMVLLDNIHPDATIAHALMILNGRCTDTDRRMQMMTFLLERAWGLVLGLGPAQFDPHALNRGDLPGSAGMAGHAADGRRLRPFRRHLHSQSHRTAL